MPRSNTFARVKPTVVGRRFTTEQTVAVIAETMQPGMSISYVASATDSRRA